MSGITLVREFAASRFSVLGLIPFIIVAALALGACSDDDDDPYVTYDDFTGAEGEAPNSTKWTQVVTSPSDVIISNNTMRASLLADGSLQDNNARLFMTAAGSPGTTTGIQVDLLVGAVNIAGGNVRARLGGSFYSDRTLAGSAGSFVSDIFALIQVRNFIGLTGSADYRLVRCTDSTCSTVDTLVDHTSLGSVEAGTNHTYRIEVDTTTSVFTFRFDGTSATVDAAAAGAAYVAAANNPSLQIGIRGSAFPTSSGLSAMEATFDNFRCKGCVVP